MLQSHEEIIKQYDRAYFEDGTTGYRLYRDFPISWKTFHIVLEREPISVLELGCAYGFLTKKLNSAGIIAWGIDASEHCWHRRVTNNFVLQDACKPLPFQEKEFDLVCSFDFMDHLLPEKIPGLIKEMERVAKRGLHGISCKYSPNDLNHIIIKPKSWWKNVLPSSHEIIEKSDLELLSLPLPQGDETIKLNIGSFVYMFYYGWVNIDILDVQQEGVTNGHIFHQHDVRNGLEYDENTVNLIYTSHFLEHLTPEEGLTFLKEAYRVLRKGAIIRVIVPDAKLLIKKYQEGKLDEYDSLNPIVAKSRTEAERLRALLWDHHQSLYDAKALDHTLKMAGFQNVQEMEFEISQSEQMQKETFDSLPTVSLCMEAVK